jgi:hypothetical protein
MTPRKVARAVTVAGSIARLSYALGLLLAPERMGRLRLGAATSGNGMASMTTRAFGALHANLALATLLAALRDRHLELALRANVAGDFGDLAGPLLEWRFGSLGPQLATANAVVQSAGIATWTFALRGLRNPD